MQVITQRRIGAKFATADYVVFAAMLLISAAIGVYYGIVGRKKSTTSEFLMGGRSLKVFPVSLSVLASFMSAITLLGTPAEIYHYGTQYCMIAVGYCFLIPAAAYLYLPTFYNLGLTSAYEYLELRFNRLVRTLGSLTFSIQMIVYMAIVLYAPALALSQVTGINVWVAVASIGIVCTFYTSVGGIKAVVVTDVFQVLLMFAAMFVVVFKGAADVGGWEYVWKINREGHRLQLFKYLSSIIGEDANNKNFDPDPTTRHTVWNLAIGGYFTWLAVYGVNQAMVQRYMTIPTLKGAQRVIWINLPGLCLLLAITSMAGLVIYAKYHDCDPKLSGLIEAPDQLFPLFVMDTLGSLPGLPGLFVAGIFSGALSTVSSGVNSLAAVTLEDLVRAYINPNISEIWATRLTKILAMFYGILAIVLVAVAEQLGNVLQAALSSLGMFGGPVLGMFTLGMFVPWCNSSGAAVGLLSGLAVSFWIGFGAFIHKPSHPLAPVSTAGCVIVSFLNMTLDDDNSTLLDSQLFDTTTPFIVKTTPALPSDLESQDPLIGLYKISYMYYCTIGCIVAVIVGIVVSIITGVNEPEDVDPRLITPVFDIVCPFLPSSIRQKLRFNVGANVKIPLKKETIPSCEQKPKITDVLKDKGHANQAYEAHNDEKLVISSTRF